jgi:hypothetical protein
VSSDDVVSWFYDQDRLTEVLDRWRALEPPEDHRTAVDEALMDLIKDPTNWGEEDEERGVWTGWANHRILIVYVWNDDGRVSVADINYG